MTPAIRTVDAEGQAAPRTAAIGCMRLSTGPDRDDERAIAVIHAALDAGVALLDTADAYCRDHTDVGHNERLIARALGTWTGDRSRVVVATKGGLTRPEGRWVPDGRARHLAAACEASLRALGFDRLPLYQLHAPDPRTPLSTSVRALASLRRQGLIDAIGLCNVTVGQIEEARRITEIASVQIELSPWHDDGILSGVAGYCVAHRLRLLAHRPFGGPQRRNRPGADPLLAGLAARHGATPFEVVLAWIADLAEGIVPLPGPTREETARSAARALALVLTDEDRARLDERFPAGRRLRGGGGPPARPAPRAAAGEVVLIMGLPGAGKSTLAATFVGRGYTRLNRDATGGTLRGLAPALDRALAPDGSRVVLDNTYLSRKSRAVVVQAASAHGVPVRCLWLSTSLEDAQTNAAWRIVSRYGRLLNDDEARAARKQDVSAFGPGVLFRAQRELEPPGPGEGFSRVDVVPFERARDPSFVHRAVLLWCDGVLRASRSGRRTPASADDVEVLAGRREVLQRYHSAGWRLLGLSWQPEVADGTQSAADVEAALARMVELLGVPMESAYCPHGAGPPTCWCRKPLPGLGVLLVQRHRLDPRQCIYVGAGTQDPGFARRLGFQYCDAGEFFASGGPERDGT